MPPNLAPIFGLLRLPNWFFPPRPRRYFRVAEIRYLAQKRDKYFDAFTRQIFLPLAFYMDQKMGYREFRAKANSRKIQCEHHLVVCLFVCGKFLLAGIAGFPGRRGRRPLQVYGFSVAQPSERIFAVFHGK